MTRARDISRIYTRTAAEIAAGVTPTDTSYPAGDVRRYGAVGNGVATDYSSVVNAIRQNEADGGAPVYLPPLTYNCEDASEQIEITGSHVTIHGYGATLLNTRLYVTQSSEYLTVKGVRFLDDRASGTTYHLSIYGSRFTFEDVTLEKDPIAGGYQAYIRQTSSFGTFRNVKTFGSNGIFVAGHDHTFDCCQIECRGVTAGAGTDDAYAIKAAVSAGVDPAETYNISITGGSVRGFYDIVGIGSEIGRPGVAGDYTSYVKNVSVTGVTAYNCATLVYVKPNGASADYRNGLVQNVAITGCTLLDPDGTNFFAGLFLTASRGGRIHGVTMSNCIVRARAYTAGVISAGVLIRTQGAVDVCDISEVHVNNCQFIDNHAGVDNGVSTPGYPVMVGCYIERQNTGAYTDTITEIHISNNVFLGTRDAGVIMEGSPQGPIKFVGNSFTEVGVNPTAGSYRNVFGVTSASDVSFCRNVFETANTQRTADYSTFFAKTDKATCYVGTATAGTALQSPCFVAPNDCYIWKIELLNSAAITQSDANYSTYEFRNMDTGNVLATATTRVTGGLNIPDDSPPLAISATAYTGVDAYLPMGGVLRFSKADTGSGQPINNMFAVVHFLAYNN